MFVEGQFGEERLDPGYYLAIALPVRKRHLDMLDALRLESLDRCAVEIAIVAFSEPNGGQAVRRLPVLPVRGRSWLLVRDARNGGLVRS
jgi:hypothetical protein